MKNVKGLKVVTLGVMASLLAFPLLSGGDASETVLAAERANSVKTESPIKEAYAGGEFVLFLHEDTSITGFGSNINNVLGMSGGENANTGEIIQVSGPTGFTHLKARRAWAYGYRPLDESPNIFNWVDINEDIVTPREENVLDADWSGRTAPGINHHDGYLKIDATGQVWAAGSDYWTHLGYGPGNPYMRYQFGVWNRVISPKERIVVADGNDAVTYSGFQNTNNGANVVVTSSVFTIPPEFDGWDIDTQYVLPSGVGTDEGLSASSLKFEIIDSTGNVVKTIIDPYRVSGSSAFNARPYSPIEGLPAGDYSIRATSSNTGWVIRIVERDYFKNGLKAAFAWGLTGRFTVMDTNKKLFTHSSGWGQVRPVTSPEFDAVTIIPESLVAGSTHFGAIDESGKAWTWETQTPTLVPFPDMEGLPFYDTRIVKKMSTGGGFTLAVVEVKGSGITEAWSWGNNNYGKLGLDPVPSNTNIPTRIERNGDPLTGIISVAAGDNHSVVVQNTVDGQLVWTSGHNAKGQLGGGMQLNIITPQLVPGLTGIKRLAVQNTPEVAAVGAGKLFAFGGPKSYPEETNLGRLDASLQDKSFDMWVQSQENYWRQSIFSRPTGASHLLTSGDRKAYSFGYTGYASTSINGRGFTPIVIDSAFDGQFGRALGDMEFRNVKDITAPGFAGVLVDENGRLWGWGYGTRSGVRLQANYGPHATTGEFQYTNGAHPLKFSDDSLVPAIFEKVASDYNAGYALSNTGKLWYITSTIAPINPAWAVNNVNLVEISGGSTHRYLAIDDTGALWHWFRGGEPKKMDKSLYNNEDVVKISAGLDHSLFITSSGQVWGFGVNSYGRLGDGTEINSDVPIKALNVNSAVEVYAGNDFSMAVDDQGRVWSWGYAAYGSLGNNFSLSREKLSTAVGNDLPVMSIENELKTNYYSQYGNSVIRLEGTVQEKEQEDVTIKATMLGVEKTAVITADSWDVDIYDEVKPQNWSMSWDVTEIPSQNNFQSLSKVAGEDTRGGIVEQFFAGGFIIDNEAPVAPSWGDTCILEDAGNVCHTGPYFSKDGTNGVNKPVRIYVTPKQKIGDYKAPVSVQVAYRKKQAYGYAPGYSEWIDVTESDEFGMYHEFFQGFQGETQIKIRSIDKAGNVSSENDEYRYVIISNAGATVDFLGIEPSFTESELMNKLTILGKTEVGSSLQSYYIEKRLSGTTPWTAVTDGREAWSVGDKEEVIVEDVDIDMAGNALYEYKVDLENTVAVGAPTIKQVYSSPYKPANFLIRGKETGLTFTLQQDERNQNSILYRLVLIDNNSGEIYSQDKTANSAVSELIFDVLEEDTVFSILNNSLKVQVIMKGENGVFRTIVYNEDFVNKLSTTNDTVAPSVFLNIENGLTSIPKNGMNPINLTVSASDSVTLPNNLRVQFSKDGHNWFGTNSSGVWYKDHWANYTGLYKGFELGEKAGTYVIQARVQDEAGNTGYSNAKITIEEEIVRDELSRPTDPINTPSDDSTIYVNGPEIYLDIPKTGNITEVQFSFDGINWSPWEKIDEYYTKYITFDNVGGRKNVFVRYRNASGNISKINPDTDVVRYIYDEEGPDAEIRTINGTNIVKGTSVVFDIKPEDALSPTVDIQLLNTELSLAIGAVGITTPYTMDKGNVYRAFVNGLVPGFNTVRFELTDKSGNTVVKSVRVFSK